MFKLGFDSIFMVVSFDQKIIAHYVLRTSEIVFFEGNFVWIKIKDEVEIQYEDSEEQFQLFKKHHSPGNRYLVLIEPGRYTSISKEAREVGMRKEANEMSTAIAVIIHSLAQRLIINFQSKFVSKAKTQMRAFDSKDEGLMWLKNFKSQSAN